MRKRSTLWVCDAQTRTRTNTHPYDTGANAAGKSARACVARDSKHKKAREDAYVALKPKPVEDKLRGLNAQKLRLFTTAPEQAAGNPYVALQTATNYSPQVQANWLTAVRFPAEAKTQTSTHPYDTETGNLVKAASRL